MTKIKRAHWKYCFYCHSTPPKSHLWSLSPKCLFNLWPWFQRGMFKAKQMPWKALRNQKYFNKSTLKMHCFFSPFKNKNSPPLLFLPPFLFSTASLSLLCCWNFGICHRCEGESNLAAAKQSGMDNLRSRAPILSPEHTTLPAALNGQYYVISSLLLRRQEPGSIRTKEEWKACLTRLYSDV